MMYYAVGKDASKGDSELNDEFDAQYNTADYEIKIGRLLQHAYVRLNETEPETARRWDDSIAFLGKGHHYISILWDSKYPAERPPHDFLKLLGSAIVVFSVIMTIAAFSNRMSRLFPHFPVPGWVVRRLAVIGLVALYFGWRYLAKRRRAQERTNSETA
jgi:hypothetical protein